jgi:hypothetical protein
MVITKNLRCLVRRVDVSPCGSSSMIKMAVFLSWLVTVLFFTSYDFLPENTFIANIVNDYFQQTDVLSPVDLPPITVISFPRSLIGTVSSFNVFISPFQIILTERGRSPPAV